ncbi:MAG: M14 family metallopeptidase, partial [Candidatus Bathyarchaeota archaeon]|nr:M14 family metallopeptidase [Candidatus Bathyarchaeota archaeon]
MSVRISSPEEFFGFQLGSEGNIARWDRIVEYFNVLATQSDAIQVVNMGPSTEGHPFLLVVISSSENLANLVQLKKMTAQISDPRGVSEEKMEALIAEGKAVICQSMSLHASEIGGTQMAPELAYDLLTRRDEEARRILENVVFLMIPCFNPDGQIMVTDWYTKWLGTEYEGGRLPWLYHKYAGHDNNRDAFMTNLVESQYMAQIMFREWHPQAYVDHHHMGSYGARLYIPPYCEPIRPHADPLIWRELSWYGAHMAYKLEEAGKTGILNNAQYAGWGHFGFHWIGNFHNIASMLTESANAKLATPLYIHSTQLTGQNGSTLRGFAEYKPQTNFPHPWSGGWWRLRDVVEQQKIAAWSLLDMAARNKETVLRNAYLKGKRQTKRGAEGTPKAYAIPLSQHDPLTAAKLVEHLLGQGIEVKRALQSFTVDGLRYPQGTYVIFLAQPKSGLIKNLLGRTLYPDDAWSRESDNTPRRPYDTATDTIAEFMGVRVDPIESRFEGEFEVVTKPEKPAGTVVGRSTTGYVFDGRLNDSFKAANMLLSKGVTVRRIDEALQVDDHWFPPGSFISSADAENILKDIAREQGISFHALEKELDVAVHEVKQPRIAMYQRFYGGNMDEGWTRLLLEQFSFPYTTVTDDEVKKGGLTEQYDVFILPDDAAPLITGEKLEEYYEKRFKGRRVLPKDPPEYRSGIGKEGVENLKKFVDEGGTLIAFNEASQLALESFGLRVNNVLKDVKPKEFFCPGSMLKAEIDSSHRLAFGMPEKALVLFMNGPA